MLKVLKRSHIGTKQHVFIPYVKVHERIVSTRLFRGLKQLRGVAYGLQLFLEYLKEKMLVVIIAHCAPSITYAALLRRLDWVN